MVPQYKPESVLMLGYDEGTVAGLIKLLYGDVPITGVDINPCFDRYGSTLIQADANEYVKTCGKFDCVIIDLFPNGGFENCPFITNKEFVDNLERISNYVIVNTLKNPDLSEYNRFRKMGENSPSGSANIIHYYEVHPIPDLHPYKL